MKPDFALSLSFEGIALLVRAAGGWRNAGEVSLDAPDLGGALAALRARAVDLGGAAFRTKLIIPKDQIRYLTISTGHLSAADRHAEVRRALDGATPYAVDELSYDICEDGPLTHVAAVARETLEEAEAFAVEHRFNPVSFVAIPGDENFLGEPFFGATAFSRKALAPGERVEPDGVSVVVIGPVGTPGVEPSKADAAPEEPAAEPADEAPPEDTGPMPGFSSRRAADGPAPPLGGATRTAAIAPRITVGLPAAEESAAPPPFPDPAPSGASIAAPAATRDVPDAPATPLTAAETRRADSAPRATAIEPPAPGMGVAAPHLGDDSAADAPGAPEAAKGWTMRFLSRRARPAPSGEAAPGAQGSAEADPKPGMRIPRPRLPAAAQKAAPTRAALAERVPLTGKPAMVAAARRPLAESVTSQDERERMTIFGARSSEIEVGGKPRHLGLILTALLLLFLAVVAAWASIFTEEGLSGLFKRDDPPPLIAVVPGPADPPVATLAPDPAETAATETARTENPPTETAPDAPGPAEPALAAPSPVDPDMTEAPAQVALAPQDGGLSDTDAAVLDALRVTGPQAEPEADPEPRLQVEAPARALTPEEAQTRYAVSGIWELAPEAPREPAMIGLDDLYLTSIDTAIAVQDAVALPVVAGFAADAVPARLSTPIAPGLQVTLDENGRVLATVEGAVSPDGFTVYLGRPPLVPPPTPTRFETAPEVEAVSEPVSRTRPRPRPETLIETNERAQLGGLSRAELAGLRPRTRPASVLQAAEAQAIEAAVQAAALQAQSEAIANATSQAVLASLQPRTRPSDLATGRVEAPRSAAQSSQAEAEAEAEADGQEEETVQVASVATVAPSIPSTASVSRQATVKNAINLRRVNLIGVYGTPSKRRALIRLPNGRYQKVEVGDRLDGGRVSAIGESELRYQKNGRNLVLSMPSG